MNAIARFFVLGLQDADRRLAAVLTPPALDQADRYLRGSAIVRTIDRATVRLCDWWIHSTARRLLSATGETFAEIGWAGRYHAIAVFMLVAVAVHVGLTLLEGPRPDWFLTVIPSMAAVFASILLAASFRNHR